MSDHNAMDLTGDVDPNNPYSHTPTTPNIQQPGGYPQTTSTTPPQQQQFAVPTQRLPPPRKGSSQSFKKKKGIKKGGAGQPKSQQASAASRKKGAVKQEEVVTFDTSNLHAPLPVNLRVYAKHAGTNRWYEIRILERKERNKTEEEEQGLFFETMAEQAGDTNDYSNHGYIYYVHYVEWDRRMDDWITRDRIRFYFQISDLLQQQAQQLKRSESGALTAADRSGSEPALKTEFQDEEKAEAIRGSMGDGQVVETQTARPQKGAGKGAKTEQKEGDDAAAHAAVDPASATGNAGHGHGHFSEEDLRAHEEATKVKNIDAIVFGKYRMTTWYYSPFPQEYNRFKTLWFCEFCLNFFGYENELKLHSQRCIMRHPPGDEIYRSKERNVTVAVFEVDGMVEKVYCQNLCYIGKLYLDHKTLEYDCTPFLFYIICELDDMGYHPVGYFSKEKAYNSAFNLACILTLPCHQRKGYGKFIISTSYELSKAEERVGSPEKPISDLGQQAYSSYWSYTLIQLLAKRKVGEQFSIEDLSRQTCITCDDIIETLKLLKVLQWYQNRWVFSETQVQKLEADRIRRDEKLQKSLEADPTAMFVAPMRAELLHFAPYVQKKKANQQQSLYI